MKLIANWRAVLRRAWSFRLIIVSGLLSGVDVAMPFIQQSIEPLQIIPAGSFAILAVLASVAAAIARVLVQPAEKAA